MLTGLLGLGEWMPRLTLPSHWDQMSCSLEPQCHVMANTWSLKMLPVTLLNTCLTNPAELTLSAFLNHLS